MESNPVEHCRVRDGLTATASRLAAAGVESHRFEARVLMAEVLDCQPADVALRPDLLLSPEQCSRLEALVARRVRREPLQYILGYTEFFSLRMKVTPDVLIPRPETELLVEAVLEEVPRDRPALLADLGTGSGAVAVALALELPLAEVAAVDVSHAALAVAATNAAAHGVTGRVRLLAGRWCGPLAAAGLEGRLRALVSNPPYISLDEAPHLDPEIRNHEPAVALFTGEDPLEPYREIAVGCARFLEPEGLLALECAPHRAQAVASVFHSLGWRDVRVIPDYAGLPRVVRARPAPAPGPAGADSGPAGCGRPGGGRLS